MKKLLLPLAGAILFMSVGAFAEDVSMRDLSLSVIQPSTYPYCVALTTYSWTQFNPPESLPQFQRDGLWVYNPVGNSANMIYAITQSSGATASYAPLAPGTTSQVDGIIIKGNPASTLRVPYFMRLWLMSLNTAAESICGREYRQ